MADICYFSLLAPLVHQLLVLVTENILKNEQKVGLLLQKRTDTRGVL